MNKSIIHIASTIDEHYIQHLGVMLCSLFENNLENKFCIYVLIDFEKNKETYKLEKMVRHYNQKIIFFSINIERMDGLKVNGHVSKAAYFRLLLPEYVHNYTDKLLYLDSDLIVKKNIKEMWETNISNNAVAAVNEPGEEGVFNSGVMLINISKWLDSDITNLALTYGKNNHDKIKLWDQDVLNEIFKGQWVSLPGAWNRTSYYFQNSNSLNSLLNTDTGILHFTGVHKPWDFFCQHPYKSEYFYYLKKTPWKGFLLKEDTFNHRFKQQLKKMANMITGKKIFEIYA